MPQHDQTLASPGNSGKQKRSRRSTRANSTSQASESDAATPLTKRRALSGAVRAPGTAGGEQARSPASAVSSARLAQRTPRNQRMPTGVLAGLDEDRQMLQSKVSSLRSELAKAEANRACMVAKQAQVEAEMKLNKDVMDAVAKDYDSAQHVCFTLEQQLELERQKLSESEEAMQNHQAQLESEATEYANRCRELQEKIKQTQQSSDDWEAKAQEADRQCKEVAERCQEAENLLLSMVEKTNEVKKATNNAEVEVRKAEERLAAARESRQAMERQAAEAEAQVKLLPNETAKLVQAVAEARTKMDVTNAHKKAPTSAGDLGSCTQTQAETAAPNAGSFAAQEMLCFNLTSPGVTLKQTASQKLMVSSEAMPHLVGEYKLMDVVVNDRPAYCRQSGAEPMCIVWMHKLSPSAGRSMKGQMGPLAGKHHAWVFTTVAAAEKAFGAAEAAANAESSRQFNLELPLEEVLAWSLQESKTTMPYEMARPNFWDGSSKEAKLLSIAPL